MLNAETLRALEDLRQNRDDARETADATEKSAGHANAARAQARIALERAQEAYGKAVSEAFDLWEVS